MSRPTKRQRLQEQAIAAQAASVFPTHLVAALADGTPIDRADGTALDLSETEALAAWRAGVAPVVRS